MKTSLFAGLLLVVFGIASLVAPVPHSGVEVKPGHKNRHAHLVVQRSGTPRSAQFGNHSVVAVTIARSSW
jgi:hypothetical protein